MTSSFKKDIILSIVAGEITSWFIIFVIKNPLIVEAQKFVQLQNFAVYLPIIVPLFFIFGIIGGKLFQKIFPFLYQFAKFVEIGILNTFIDLGILNFLASLTGITSGPFLIPITATSFLAAVTNSYFWNKFWTFERKIEMKKKEFLPFLIISAIGLGINTGIVFLGATYISPFGNISPGAWLNLVKILAVLIVMFWNFFGYKFFVFKKSR